MPPWWKTVATSSNVQSDLPRFTEITMFDVHMVGNSIYDEDCLAASQMVTIERCVGVKCRCRKKLGREEYSPD